MSLNHLLKILQAKHGCRPVNIDQSLLALSSSEAYQLAQDERIAIASHEYSWPQQWRQAADPMHLLQRRRHFHFAKAKDMEQRFPEPRGGAQEVSTDFHLSHIQCPGGNPPHS